MAPVVGSAASSCLETCLNMLPTALEVAPIILSNCWLAWGIWLLMVELF